MEICFCRPCLGTPVKGAIINDGSSNRVTVSTDPLRATACNDVDAKLERPTSKTAHAERIINNEWDLVFFTNGTDSFEIGDVEAWVSKSFVVHSLTVVAKLFQRSLELIQVLAIDEFYCDAHKRKCVLKLGISSSSSRCNNTISTLSKGQKRVQSVPTPLAVASALGCAPSSSHLAPSNFASRYSKTCAVGFIMRV